MADIDDAAVQRQACRAALEATIGSLLDLNIPQGIIIEVLASAAVSLSKINAVRHARRHSSNDDQAGEPSNDQR